MRIAGENKGANTQVGIFLNTGRHCFRVTDQCRTGSTTYQAYTCPQIWGHFQLAAVAIVQFSHTALTDRIHRFKLGLCCGNGGIIDILDQLVGRLPGLLIGFTHNHMQTDAIVQTTAFGRGFGTYRFNFFFHCCRRFSPG